MPLQASPPLRYAYSEDSIERSVRLSFRDRLAAHLTKIGATVLTGCHGDEFVIMACHRFITYTINIATVPYEDLVKMDPFKFVVFEVPAPATVTLF